MGLMKSMTMMIIVKVLNQEVKTNSHLIGKLKTWLKMTTTHS